MVDKTLTQVRTDNAAVAPTGSEPIETVQSATSAAFTFAELANSPLNAQTGTAYTLAITDQSKTVTMDNAASNILTIPLNASVAFHIGAKLLVRQIGAGGCTVVGDGGVTVEIDANASLVMDGAQQQILLHKTATDTWHAAPVATGSGGGGTATAAKGAVVTRTSDVTGIAAGTYTFIYETEQYDDAGFSDLGADNDRVTVPAGVTRVNVQAWVSLDNIASTAVYTVFIRRFNSADVFQETVAIVERDSPSTESNAVNLAAVGCECAATDYFTVAISILDGAWDYLQSRLAIQDATVGSATVAFHGALVERATTLARTASAITNDFVTEVYDTDGFGDLGTNDDRLTVPVGVTKVQVQASMECSATVTGSRFIQIVHRNSGGTELRRFHNNSAPIYTDAYLAVSTTVVEVSAGDYFEVFSGSVDSSWTQTYVGMSIEYKDGTLTEAPTTVLTTKGDLMAHDTAPKRLPVGTNDQVLTADSTADEGVAWKDASGGSSASSPMQGAFISHSTTQSAGTSTVVVFDTEEYDDNGFATLGTNDDRLTVPTGVTRVNLSAYVSGSGNTANTKQTIAINHYNSSDVFQRVAASIDVELGDTSPRLDASVIGYPCVATDYFEIALFGSDASWTLDTVHFGIQDATKGSRATVAFHGALVENNSTVAQTTTTYRPVYTTEVYDTDGFGDLGTDNDRLTIPTGVTKVQVTGNIDCTALTSGSHYRMQISHFNSADSFLQSYDWQTIAENSTTTYGYGSTPVIPVAEGDYFALSIQSNDASWSTTHMSLSIEYKDGTLTEAPTTVLTTKGDLMAHSTAPERLPVGTDGQVLKADSTEDTGVKWVNGGVSGAKVSRSTDQVETVSTYTVDFTTEVYDDNSFADLGTNADRLQANGATRCNVSAYVRFSSIDDDSRIRVLINRNNVSDVFQETVAAWEGNTSSTVAHISCAAFGADCVGTDFFEVVVFSADSTTTVTESSFNIQDVSP